MPQTPLSGNSNIDALLTSYQWGTQNGQASTVSYSIPSGTAWWVNDYSPDNEPNTWSGLDLTQQQYFKQALSAWAEVANVSFTQVADNQTSTGSIRVAFSDVVAQKSASGWAYNPGTLPANGDIWLSNDLTDFSPGSHGYETLLHELGHALGLKHPNEIIEDNTNVLSGIEDNFQFTLMSYNNYGGVGFHYTSPDGVNFTETPIEPVSPMLYDIAAMQFLYGANMTTRSGNNVYTFSNSQAELKAIWDAGGTDTFDLSNQTFGQTINLNAGTFSSLGVKEIFDNGVVQAAAIDNIAIAYNVTIENAIGGSGNDTLYGNPVANTLNGGMGNDTMSGGAGNDKYVINSGADAVKENAAQGIDTILSTISYSLGNVANVENLTLTGNAAINATGNSLKNTLTGNMAINTLNGGAGNDILNGLSGNDKLIGGTGNDTLNGGLGNDVLTGDKGKDIFQLANALSTSNNIDRITDFVSADDTIQLENKVFTALNKAGVLAADMFRSGAGISTAADANDYLLYNSTDGKLYYDADGNLSIAPVQIALLGTGLALTNTDFAVI
jgi:serralysin